MKFKLDFDIPSQGFELTHGDKVTFLGSCFSDEIASKFNYFGHHTFNDPFGTIFHPAAIAKNILNAFEAQPEIRIVQRDDLFFCLEASSALYAKSEESLIEKMNIAYSELREWLCTSKTIFITLGTSWGYAVGESDSIVANCHKLPSSYFDKQLSSPWEMVQDLSLAVEKIKENNTAINIVLTVSPVRHTKDGVVENNWSKARLLEVVHQLSQEQNVSYFPSYEIVIDELRDYRFFKEDLVHPNQLAVDYIWNRVEAVYFSKETQSIHQELQRLRIAMNHKSLQPDSNENMKFIDQLKIKLENFKIKNPQVLV